MAIQFDGSSNCKIENCYIWTDDGVGDVPLGVLQVWMATGKPAKLVKHRPLRLWIRRLLDKIGDGE